MAQLSGDAKRNLSRTAGEVVAQRWVRVKRVARCNTVPLASPSALTRLDLRVKRPGAGSLPLRGRGFFSLRS
jgi:hypothetical protein